MNIPDEYIPRLLSVIDYAVRNGHDGVEHDAIEIRNLIENYRPICGPMPNMPAPEQQHDHLPKLVRRFP